MLRHMIFPSVLSPENFRSCVAVPVPQAERCRITVGPADLVDALEVAQFDGRQQTTETFSDRTVTSNSDDRTGYPGAVSAIA